MGRSSKAAQRLLWHCSRQCWVDRGTFWGFAQGVAQRFGPADHVLDYAVAGLLCLCRPTPSPVGCAVLAQRVEQPGELVRGGRDRLWGS